MLRAFCMFRHTPRAVSIRQQRRGLRFAPRVENIIKQKCKQKPNVLKFLHEEVIPHLKVVETETNPLQALVEAFDVKPWKQEKGPNNENMWELRLRNRDIKDNACRVLVYWKVDLADEGELVVHDFWFKSEL